MSRAPQSGRIFWKGRSMGDVSCKDETSFVGFGGWHGETECTVKAEVGGWYSAVPPRRRLPWMWDIRGNPQPQIAAGELANQGIMLLSGVFKGCRIAGMTVMAPVETDNQGNTFILHKNLSTRQPVGAVLCWLAEVQQKVGCAIRPMWIERDSNKWSDELAEENVDLSDWPADKRIEVDWDWFSGIERWLPDDWRELREARLLKKRKTCSG